ncbi:unnamed protein product [Mytilus coruscus]|uniref:Uncharacterized protein n=1 Tax=Mytilus coruscus TaxID=42192 RepID=A0A6J8BVA3_MYTCO|nr:unnamed protein product [Mytilus coruscus]
MYSRQHPSQDSHGTVRVMTCISENVKRDSIKPLPERYSVVPPVILPKEPTAIPSVDNPLFIECGFFSGAQQLEYRWLTHVRQEIEDDDTDTKNMTWSAFHANLSQTQEVEIAPLDISSHEQSKGPNVRNHEQVESKQKAFVKQVITLTATIEEMGNPNLEESEDLLVLDTRDIVDPKLQTHRLDVIWDEYRQDSLKASTRGKRGKGIRRRVQADSTIPGNWESFLRIDDNKTELFAYLAEQLLTLTPSDQTTVVSTKGREVCTSSGAVSTYISGILACDSSKQRNCAIKSSADTRTVRVLIHIKENTSGIGTTPVVSFEYIMGRSSCGDVFCQINLPGGFPMIPVQVNTTVSPSRKNVEGFLVDCKYMRFHRSFGRDQ